MLLGEGDELAANPLTTPLRDYGNGLNVAQESSTQIQDDKSRKDVFLQSDVDFPVRIIHCSKAVLITSAQGCPWLRAGHELCAQMGFVRILQAADCERRFQQCY